MFLYVPFKNSLVFLPVIVLLITKGIGNGVLCRALESSYNKLHEGHWITKRYALVLYKHKWNRCLLTWAFRDPFRLFRTTKDFKLAKKAVQKAILTWQRESGKLFRLVDVSPSIQSPALSQKRVAHIDIFFAKYAHGDLEAFDGVGGMVAHSAYPMEGIVHFDGSEQWTVGGAANLEKTPTNMVDLRYAALHELGHALGLRHSTYSKSVMNPYYSELATGNLHLSKDDILGIEELYGHCRQ